MKRTANEIAELFTNGRELKWSYEPADFLVNYDRDVTSIMLTTKQWNWLLNTYRSEIKDWSTDEASGTLSDGSYWWAKYAGYYTKDRNGSAKMTITRKK